MLGGVEALDVRPPVALARVQRGVGVVDDLMSVGARRGEGGDADRDRERTRPAVVATQRRGEQVVGDDLGALGVARRQQERELVAAGAVGAVAAAQVGPHDLGDRPQQVVARRVAALVVDRLEVVDVDHHQGERLAVVARLGDPDVELLLETAVVAEPGQPVEQRVEAGPVVGLAELAHVVVDRGEATADRTAQDEQDHPEQQRAPDGHREGDRDRGAREAPDGQRQVDGLQRQGGGYDDEGEGGSGIRRARDRAEWSPIELAFVAVMWRQIGPPAPSRGVAPTYTGHGCPRPPHDGPMTQPAARSAAVGDGASEQ